MNGGAMHGQQNEHQEKLGINSNTRRKRKKVKTCRKVGRKWVRKKGEKAGKWKESDK